MQVTRTYEIKLKLNRAQQHQINEYFYEAKCLYNYLLAQEDIFSVNACKLHEIYKLDKDGNKTVVSINYLPAAIKQSVHRNMMYSIKGLLASKKNGRKVGKLKFKSEYNSIEFNNQCFSILENQKRLKLAGFGRTLIKGFGFHQFDNVIKYRNARLIKKPSGYYLKVCVIKEIEPHTTCKQNLGIDMGIKDTINFSTGEKYDCWIEETVRLKRLSRKYSRMILLNGRRTNNSMKVLKQLKREYERIGNKKKEFVNQMLNKIDSFDHVAFQDEQIAGWRNLNGNKRKIQHSCLGSIKQKLIQKVSEEPERYTMLNKWLPTTQLCPNCGQQNKISLLDRIYKCDCGYECDRDTHSAKNMLVFAGLS